MLSSVDFHKDFVTLRIASHEIGVGGLKLTYRLSVESVSALLFEAGNELFAWKAKVAFPVSFQLERETDYSFKVTVDAHSELISSCVRCLDPVEHQFALNFSIRMLEKEHFTERSKGSSDWLLDDAELLMEGDEDSSVGYFANSCIDLGLILRDQIFYEAPDYPHCKSTTCKSLTKYTEGQKEALNPFLRLIKKS